MVANKFVSHMNIKEIGYEENLASLFSCASVFRRTVSFSVYCWGEGTRPSGESDANGQRQSRRCRAAQSAGRR